MKAKPTFSEIVQEVSLIKDSLSEGEILHIISKMTTQKTVKSKKVYNRKASKNSDLEAFLLGQFKK
jgi:hypothetical protein